MDILMEALGDNKDSNRYCVLLSICVMKLLTDFCFAFQGGFGGMPGGGFGGLGGQQQQQAGSNFGFGRK